MRSRPDPTEGRWPERPLTAQEAALESARAASSLPLFTGAPHPGPRPRDPRCVQVRHVAGRTAISGFWCWTPTKATKERQPKWPALCRVRGLSSECLDDRYRLAGAGSLRETAAYIVGATERGNGTHPIKTAAFAV
jgi:hypothetical protein